MPSPRPSSQRIRERLPEKSMSFHGRGSVVSGATGELRRPKTLPNMPSASRIGSGGSDLRPKMTKLLLNVTIQGSLGPVQVLMSPDSSVGDLIAAAVRFYVKEGRRPVLPDSDPSGYDLHYSQFSLESLNRDEKLSELGSRNFFLCKRNEGEIDYAEPSANFGCNKTTSSSSCSKQVDDKGRKSGIGMPWIKLFGFLQ